MSPPGQAFVTRAQNPEFLDGAKALLPPIDVPAPEGASQSFPRVDGTQKTLSFHFLTKPLRRAHCLAPPRAHFPGFGVVCRFHFPLCGSFVLPGQGGFESLVLHQSDPRAQPLGVFSPSNPGILAHGKVGVPTGLWAPCGMSFAAPALPEALQPLAFPAFSALRTRPIPIPAQLQNQRLP